MNPEILADPNLKDIFLELANIGIGRAAANMSDLAGRSVDISVPELELFNESSLEKIVSQDETIAYVVQNFEGDLKGSAYILFSESAAIQLASLLFGEDETGGRFDESEQNSILELGNIMIGGIMGTFCNEFSASINYHVPEIQLKGMSDLIQFIDPDSTFALTIQATLSIGGDNVNSHILLIYEKDTHAFLSQKLGTLLND